MTCVATDQMHKASLSCLNSLSQETPSFLGFRGHRQIRFVPKFLVFILYDKDTRPDWWCLVLGRVGWSRCFQADGGSQRCCVRRWPPFALAASSIPFQKSELCSVFGCVFFLFFFFNTLNFSQPSEEMHLHF